MPATDTPSLLDQLDAMRRRLVERAYDLDRGGQPVAADLAMETAAQLAELSAHSVGTPDDPRTRVSWGDSVTPHR